jgi:hypothetical protein
MAAHVEQRVESMDVQQRAMSKEKRSSQLQQAELVKQQRIQASQSESLAYQRICNRTKREKMKTTNSKVGSLLFFRFVLSRFFFDSLIALSS